VSLLSFDCVILGGGPGGYVAAIRASQLGLKTALIEADHLGGVCLNIGCIPTKALLKSAEVYNTIQNCEEFGIKCDNIQYNWSKIFKRAHVISSQLNKGVEFLLKKHKVHIIKGRGVFESENTVVVDALKIQGKNIIIATGARSRTIFDILDSKNIESDSNAEFENRVWTSKEAINPPFQPKSILIIGSGAIGVEFASFYNALGIKVRVLEISDRILAHEDDEISDFALESFKKKGIDFSLSTSVSKIKVTNDCVVATIKNNNFSFDCVLVAVGVKGNINDLNLEKIGVKTEKSFITTEGFETNINGVYAIGDVAGPPWLAHKASHEGILCVEKIMGHSHSLNKNNIPGCTYSNPQIASVGLTEKKAKEIKGNIRIGRFPFSGNGKALAIGELKGFIKTIFDARTGELLGAHMIGADVTELIQGFVIAKNLETTEEELIQTIFPHPTLSEMMHESVLNAFDLTLHL
jgi:dihydrolipoamide dehydrogenase